MWIARNKSGWLLLFSVTPIRSVEFENGFWYVEYGWYMELDPSLFPELKWEDEPLEVEILQKDVGGKSNKELREIIKKQDTAIDKALECSRILRGFLEFPNKVAERVIIEVDNDPASAYKNGYEKALLDIKEALGIKKYLTKTDIDEVLADVDKICNDVSN